jgi:hypothetical protein
MVRPNADPELFNCEHLLGRPTHALHTLEVVEGIQFDRGEMKQDEGFNAATETYEELVKAGSSIRRRSCAARCRPPRRSPRS